MGGGGWFFDGLELREVERVIDPFIYATYLRRGGRVERSAHYDLRVEFHNDGR